MAELPAPSAITVTEIVYNRIQAELPQMIREAVAPSKAAPDAFEHGRLVGQTEGRVADEGTMRDQQAEIDRLNARLTTANEAYLNVATERDGVRDEHAHCHTDFRFVCHERNEAEGKHAQEAARARSLYRRLELVRAYYNPYREAADPRVRGALDDAVDPWSILLPNEPF